MPEEIINDWAVSEKVGYTESKLVAERLIDDGCKKSHVRSAICRVGQIAGPASKYGVWNGKEWLPSLMTSSVYLGKIPETLGSMSIIDWIPVDILTSILTELILETSERLIKSRSNESLSNCACGLQHNLSAWGVKQINGEINREAENHVELTIGTRTISPTVFNIVNPRTTTWSVLLPCILSCKPGLSIVSYKSWVEELRRSVPQTPTPESLFQNPAVKITGYFERLLEQEATGMNRATLETRETMTRSATMRKLEPVNPSWMENWVRQWEKE